MNIVGNPKVKAQSQKTCVLQTNLIGKILHKMIRYDRAQIKDKNNISIIFYTFSRVRPVAGCGVVVHASVVVH